MSDLLRGFSRRPHTGSKKRLRLSNAQPCPPRYAQAPEAMWVDVNGRLLVPFEPGGHNCADWCRKTSRSLLPGTHALELQCVLPPTRNHPRRPLGSRPTLSRSPSCVSQRSGAWNRPPIHGERRECHPADGVRALERGHGEPQPGSPHLEPRRSPNVIHAPSSGGNAEPDVLLTGLLADEVLAAKGTAECPETRARSSPTRLISGLERSGRLAFGCSSLADSERRTGCERYTKRSCSATRVPFEGQPR